MSYLKFLTHFQGRYFFFFFLVDSGLPVGSKDGMFS